MNTDILHRDRNASLSYLVREALFKYCSQRVNIDYRHAVIFFGRNNGIKASEVKVKSGDRKSVV